jgi:hypothetical protein
MYYEKTNIRRAKFFDIDRLTITKKVLPATQATPFVIF